MVQLVVSFISVVALVDTYYLPDESASLVCFSSVAFTLSQSITRFSLDVIRYHRFIAHACCPCIFCFALLVPQMVSHFSDVSMITVRTNCSVHQLGLFLIHNLVFKMYQQVPQCSMSFHWHTNPVGFLCSVESFTQAFNIRYCDHTPALWCVLMLLTPETGRHFW